MNMALNIVVSAGIAWAIITAILPFCLKPKTDEGFRGWGLVIAATGGICAAIIKSQTDCISISWLSASANVFAEAILAFNSALGGAVIGRSKSFFGISDSSEAQSNNPPTTKESILVRLEMHAIQQNS